MCRKVQSFPFEEMRNQRLFFYSFYRKTTCPCSPERYCQQAVSLSEYLLSCDMPFVRKQKKRQLRKAELIKSFLSFIKYWQYYGSKNSNKVQYFN